MIKRQKITTGSILEIPINGKYYTYAQILNDGDGIAFFDFKIDSKLTDLNLLKKKPILFILAVYNDVITKGKWLKVGKIEIRKDLHKLPMKFIQDNHKLDDLELYNPNTGEITKANKSECIGLERAAVWEAEHVEERIQDYYDGVPNRWVEDLKLK